MLWWYYLEKKNYYCINYDLWCKRFDWSYAFKSAKLERVHTQDQVKNKSVTFKLSQGNQGQYSIQVRWIRLIEYWSEWGKSKWSMGEVEDCWKSGGPHLLWKRFPDYREQVRTWSDGSGYRCSLMYFLSGLSFLLLLHFLNLHKLKYGFKQLY